MNHASAAVRLAVPAPRNTRKLLAGWLVVGLVLAACGQQDGSPLAPQSPGGASPPTLGAAAISPTDKQHQAADLGPPVARMSSPGTSFVATGAVTGNPIPFAPKPGPFANPVPPCDDCVFQALPIGFSFTFFGNTYSTFSISTNGFIGFGSNTLNGCCSGRPIPLNDDFNNIIAAAWTDLSSTYGGLISYETRGQAPNRYLVVAYQDVPWFGDEPAVSRVTSQIVLYEGSNTIEIHTTHQSTGHIYTQGVEDATGLFGAVVAGRSAANYGLVNDAVRFTTIGNFWTARAAAPVARQRPAVATLGGSLYLIGGLNAAGAAMAGVTAYTPGPNSWTSKAALPAARQGSSAAAIAGKIYLAGGNNSGGTLTRTLYVFNASTNRWASGPDLPLASGCGGAAAIGGKLYLFTGCTLLSSGTQVSTGLLHRYDPGTHLWTALHQAPAAHALGAVAAVGGKLYVAGGNNGSGASTAQVDVYDPATDSWTTVTSLPSPRVAAAGVGVAGRFLVIGGRTGSTYLGTVQLYDPFSGSWGTAAPMPTPRAGLGVGLISTDGRVYAVGGRNTSAALTTNQRYTP